MQKYNQFAKTVEQERLEAEELSTQNKSLQQKFLFLLTLDLMNSPLKTQTRRRWNLNTSNKLKN